MVLCDTGINHFLISVRDSSPGLEPEDHMEKSWLVDKGGVLSKLPRDCLAIGITGGVFNGNNAFLLSGTTSRGIVGTSGGISIEQENLFDEVGHGLERPNEVNRSFSWKKSENKSFLSTVSFLNLRVL